MNKAAEQALITYLWHNPQSYGDLSEVVYPDFFGDPSCLAVWQAITKTFNKGVDINEIVLKQYIPKATDYSWVYEEAPLRPDVYVDIVRSNYLKRELKSTLNKTLSDLDGTDTTAEFLISETENKLLQLTLLDAEKKPTDFKSVMHRTMAFIQANHAAAQHQQLVGIDLISGAINGWTGGARKGELWFIAGRPGMGKTGFALRIMATNSGLLKKRGLFLSFEMGSEPASERLIAANFKISSSRLHTGFIRKEELEALYRPLACRSCGSINIDQDVNIKRWKVKSICRDCRGDDIEHAIDEYINNPIPLDIDDRSGLKATQIVSRIKAHKIRFPDLEYVVIDYLNMIPTKGDNRAEALGDVCRVLRDTAKKTQINILLLAQLNRDLEKRPNKRPQLSDLKETGGAEETAFFLTLCIQSNMDIFIHTLVRFEPQIHCFESVRAAND